MVRAGGGARIAGLDLNRLNQGDLVDVEDLLHPPEPPRRAIVATAALALLMVIVAAVGLGQPGRNENLRRRQVALAGSDVASGSRVAVNLGHAVSVAIIDPDLAARTDQVVVRLSTMGIPLGEARATVIDGRAVLDPGTMRLLAAGEVNGEIDLRGNGATIVRHEFGFRSTNPWYLTAIGIGSLLVLLIAFANLESSLKPLLRGRSRRLSRVSAPIWGSVVGVGLVALSAALSVAEMTIATVVVVAGLGAIAGVASCSAAAGLGRRRRLRRAMKRAERGMRQAATA
jgi:hypothetical protein